MVTETDETLRMREISRSIGSGQEILGRNISETFQQGTVRRQVAEEQGMFADADGLNRLGTQLYLESEQETDRAKDLVREEQAIQEERIRRMTELSELEREQRLRLLRDEYDQRVADLGKLNTQRQEAITEMLAREQEAMERAIAEEAEAKAEAARRAAEEEAEYQSKLKVATEARDEMLAAAQDRAQGATASFSTAGGTFRTAVTAQVDHLRVMREAVEKFPVLMQEMIRNLSKMVINLG